MAKNYKIQFVSLRAGSTYILNIGGGTGTAVPLYGGAEPFTTDEDASEDQFKPVRTQSGYFRIVDNGYDAQTPAQSFNWKDLIPATDSDRPVTLTVGNTVVWHGFMQSQTFSGQLYGNPQEREFPVACPLSVLAGEDVNIDAGIRNFAYILKVVCDTIDVKSGGVMGGDGMVHISDIYVQGGADARAWLQTKIDFQNFATADAEGEMQAKYSLYEVLEDMCRFWGWTARTSGTKLFLTCCDDSSEQTFLTLTRAQLDTLAAPSTEIDTTTGGTQTTSSVSLSDSSANHIFASTDQVDSQVQGPHKAVVKADCNEHDTVVKFAPKDVEDWIEQGSSYTWVQGSEYLVGYFTCPGGMYAQTGRQGTKIGNSMKVMTSAYGGVSRRQIYQSRDAESPIIAAMLMSLANRPSTDYGNPVIQLQTLKPMAFSGGSIKFSGTTWQGSAPLEHRSNLYYIRIKLGIGMTRASAKWWYMEISNDTIVYGWDTSEHIFYVPLNGNNLMSTGIPSIGPLETRFPKIPVGSDTYGYIFIDIIDGYDMGQSSITYFSDFQIANFAIEFSRDSYQIPDVTIKRAREIKKDRVSTMQYAASNTNDSKEEWNANCIFASDNNMEYGYGLLLDVAGNILSKVSYAGTLEHPEQHLANRVTTYWATAKRKIDTELQANKVGDVTPHTKVTVTGESGTFTPIAISRNWRDDVLKLSLLQL